MKNDSKRIASAGLLVSWLISLILSCVIIYSWTFRFGPELLSNDAFLQKVAVFIYCPGATSTNTSIKYIGTGSSKYVDAVQITCTMRDGGTQLVTNDQYEFTSVAAMFGGGALLGIAIASPLFFVPFLLFGRRKPV